MPQNTSDIKSLVAWAELNHSSLDEFIEIYEDPITGLSFRAKSDILPSTRLADCSYNTTISYLNAIEATTYFSRHHSESFPTTFIDSLSEEDPHVIGHFFLVQQYLLGEKSFWWHYIRLLPQPNQPERLGIPIWWPEADQRFLDGTNAAPPIQRRRELWESEWRQGISFLKGNLRGWGEYTYNLYQWAATVFGSRSFRASLTISDDIFKDQHASPTNPSLALDHIQNDRFSVLLPVLDIGNHNGENMVEWSRGTDTFSLTNRCTITKGSQIYNYYGDKSNSELLVGYGFILPRADKDRVNLKVTPPPDVLGLRRMQACHPQVPNQQEQEFMFDVRVNADETREKNQEFMPNVQSDSEQLNLTALRCFSDGLFDTMICMVANSRERRYISDNAGYCPERDPAVFFGPLARSSFKALGFLETKVEFEAARLEQSRPSVVPQSRNQELAINYRNRQLDVLRAALLPISRRLQIISASFLSLELAFDWLRTEYPDICLPVETLISEDQEEPLPLNWDILVEDWDHTYWTVWIYILLSVEAKDSTKFQYRHPRLSQWISSIRKAQDESNDRLYAERSELETIDYMVESVAHLVGHESVQSLKLRNFASFVVKEETAPGIRGRGLQNGSGVEQDLLCIVIFDSM